MDFWHFLAGQVSWKCKDKCNGVIWHLWLASAGSPGHLTAALNHWGDNITLREVCALKKYSFPEWKQCFSCPPSAIDEIRVRKLKQPELLFSKAHGVYVENNHSSDSLWGTLSQGIFCYSIFLCKNSIYFLISSARWPGIYCPFQTFFIPEYFLALEPTNHMKHEAVQKMGILFFRSSANVCSSIHKKEE